MSESDQSCVCMYVCVYTLGVLNNYQCMHGSLCVPLGPVADAKR